MHYIKSIITICLIICGQSVLASQTKTKAEHNKENVKPLTQNKNISNTAQSTAKIAKRNGTEKSASNQKKDDNTKTVAATQPAPTRRRALPSERYPANKQRSFLHMSEIKEGTEFYPKALKLAQDSNTVISVTQQKDELQELMTTIAAQAVPDKKVNKEIEVITEKIEQKVDNAQTVQEKNQIYARYYVSCIMAIEKIAIIEKNGSSAFSHIKDKLEFLKVRLFIQIEQLCKIIETLKNYDEVFARYEFYLKESEKTKFTNVTFISKMIEKYSKCQKTLEQVNNDKIDELKKRKEQLNIAQSTIHTHTIELLNHCLFHTNRSIILFSIEKAFKDFFGAASKDTGWLYIRQNMTQISQFIAHNTQIVHAALREIKNEKFKENCKTMIDSLEKLFINIENHVQNYKENKAPFFENWAQIINRLYAQFRFLINLDFNFDLLLTEQHKESAQKIKTIKERILVFINDKLAIHETIWHIIQGNQEFDESLPEEEKSFILDQLHEALINFDQNKSWNNHDTPEKEKIERLSLMVSNNAAPLLIKYVNIYSNVFDGTNCCDSGKAEPLCHLLDQMIKNKFNKASLTEENYNLIFEKYTIIKVNILKKISLIMQVQINNNHMLTPESLNQIIERIKSLYNTYEKLNKSFFALGIEPNLANLKPSIERLGKTQENLVATLTKECAELREELEKSMIGISAESTLKNDFLKIQATRINLIKKMNTLEKFVSPESMKLNKELREKSNNLLAQFLLPVIQEYLKEIYGAVSHAILNVSINLADNNIWKEVQSIALSFEKCIERFNRDFVKQCFNNADFQEEKNKLCEIFNTLKCALYRFILQFEAEIKTDIANAQIDSSIIKQKIDNLHYASWTVEKIHNIFVDIRQFETKINLYHRILNLSKALENYTPKKVIVASPRQ